VEEDLEIKDEDVPFKKKEDKQDTERRLN